MNTKQHRSPDFDSLIKRFDYPGVKAIVLMGSYARDSAGPFSDIDLIRCISDEHFEPPAKDGSYLISIF
jgi:predicted nucleotidyltransferase